MNFFDCLRRLFAALHKRGDPRDMPCVPVGLYVPAYGTHKLKTIFFSLPFSAVDERWWVIDKQYKKNKKKYCETKNYFVLSLLVCCTKTLSVGKRRSPSRVDQYNIHSNCRPSFDVSPSQFLIKIIIYCRWRDVLR